MLESDLNVQQTGVHLGATSSRARQLGRLEAAASLGPNPQCPRQPEHHPEAVSPNCPTPCDGRTVGNLFVRTFLRAPLNS